MEVYNFESTRHFYDARPNKNVLSNLNSSFDYSNVLPQKGLNVHYSPKITNQRVDNKLKYVNPQIQLSGKVKQRQCGYDTQQSLPKSQKCSHKNIKIPARPKFKLPLNTNTPVPTRERSLKQSANSARSKSPRKHLVMNPMFTGVPLRQHTPDACSLRPVLKNKMMLERSKDMVILDFKNSADDDGDRKWLKTSFMTSRSKSPIRK